MVVSPAFGEKKRLSIFELSMQRHATHPVTSICDLYITDSKPEITAEFDICELEFCVYYPYDYLLVNISIVNCRT